MLISFLQQWSDSYTLKRAIPWKQAIRFAETYLRQKFLFERPYATELSVQKVMQLLLNNQLQSRQKKLHVQEMTQFKALSKR